MTVFVDIEEAFRFGNIWENSPIETKLKKFCRESFDSGWKIIYESRNSTWIENNGAWKLDECKEIKGLEFDDEKKALIFRLAWSGGE